MNIRKVVSALIPGPVQNYGSGKAPSFLMQQRKASSTYGGRWEMPGGKVEEGEDLKAALWRELKEELGIDAVIGEEVHTTLKPGDRTKEDEGTFYEIHFLRVLSFTGDPTPLVGQQDIAFIPTSKMLLLECIPSVTLKLVSVLNPPPPGPVQPPKPLNDRPVA